MNAHSLALLLLEGPDDPVVISVNDWGLSSPCEDPGACLVIPWEPDDDYLEVIEKGEPEPPRAWSVVVLGPEKYS